MSGFDHAKLEAELVRDEGLKLSVYRCTAGKRTIGVGRNLDDNGIHPQETAVLGITVESCIRDGITELQAMLLLNNDIMSCEAQLDKSLSWWRQLTDARQRVLLNMCFNLGIAGLLGFKNTLKMIAAGQYKAAANAMLLSKWARQVGARAARLAGMMDKGR